MKSRRKSETEWFSFFSFVTDALQDLSMRYPKFRLDFWGLLGFMGQAMFTMRFIVQWIASEKRKQSVIPVTFWYFSLGGGLILSTYAIRRMDPVFIVAYLLNPIIYSKNLYFIYKKKTEPEPSQRV
jgi:lipid-A-disaccharide synthase-like uncharacterized protein